MKYQLIALPALAATVAAQDLNSIIQVLQTALPSSLVAEALTNSAAVGSEIASQFAAGETPTWFTALPTDIQGYLVPTDLAGVSSLTAAASSLVSSASSAGFTGIGNMNASSSTPVTTAPGVIGTGTLINNNGTSVVAPNGTIIGNNNGTAAGNSSSGSSSSGLSSSTSTRSGSGSSTTSGSGSGSNSGSNSGSSSSVSDAGAAMPTAFFGMGLAGAVGMIGVLAL